MEAGELKRAKLDFKHTVVSKREDGIVEVVCGNDVMYEVEHFKEMHQACAELCEYKAQPILFKVGKYTSVSKEAREYGATAEATLLSKAEAYVIHSLAQRLLANFYLRMNKPAVPTRFFHTEAEAVQWLKEFI